MNMEIVKYDPSYSAQWDGFIDQARNGFFFFKRRYMDYHSNIFIDHSLMFFQDHKLIAILPANIDKDNLISHGGLTFGGLIFDKNMTIGKTLELFEKLLMFLKEIGINKLRYKAIPYIYHLLPSQEDLYALYRFNAKLVRRDISSAIYIDNALNFSKSKKSGVKKAKKESLEVCRSYDFKTFMYILNKNLKEKYNVTSTHTLDEIQSLANDFPDHIKLFGAFKNEEMLAGVIVFEDKIIAHTQYMASLDSGKKLGALDLIIHYLVLELYKGKKYFNFGISTENNGLYLNEGLIGQKEMFGSRGITYDFYELDLSSINIEIRKWL